jgi:hypothetical protein
VNLRQSKDNLPCGLMLNLVGFRLVNGEHFF